MEQGHFLGIYYQENKSRSKVLVQRKTRNAPRIAIKALHIAVLYANLTVEDLRIVYNEYAPIFQSSNPEKAFEEYKIALKNKHWQKLGVNVD